MVTSEQQVITTHHCHHCGEVCSDTTILSDTYMFCCSGCKFVYELLRDRNLCTYYTLEERSQISLQHLTNQRHRSKFDYLEEQAIQQQLLEFSSASLNIVTLSLPQIHCTSCLWLLEKLPRLHNGIIGSRVDYFHKELRVHYHPQNISLRDIVELLTTLGYEPELRLSTTNRESNTQHSQQHLATRSLYLKLGIAGFAFGNTMILSFPEYLSQSGELDPALRSFFGALSIFLALPVLFYSASDYFINSWRNLRQRHISVDVPVALGIVALFIRSMVEILHGTTSGYLDSFTGLVFLLLCGRLFQQKTFASITFHRDYRSYFPLAVTVLRENQETTISLASLEPGEWCLLRHNELIPADSVLETVNGHVDYSFVTGESAPVEVLKGDILYAGGKVVGKTLTTTCIKPTSQSYLTSLWNNEIFHKQPKSLYETFSDRFGAYFTGFVLVLAGVAVLFWFPDFHQAINAATAILIIACPCAMTLAAPFALGWTLNIFAKAGMFLKNTSVVLELTKLHTIIFDKTGTLTNPADGTMTFIPVSPDTTLSPEEKSFLFVALNNSLHPLSRSICANLLHSPAITAGLSMSTFEEIPGKGIRCVIGNHTIFAGSAEFTGYHSHNNSDGSNIYLVIDGCYKGYFTVQTSYRSGLEQLFRSLRRRYNLLLLSGDNQNDKQRLSTLFAGEEMIFSQSPHDKLTMVKRLQNEGLRVAMVGDGLNDAGAIQQSDVGIALAEQHNSFSPASDVILAANKLKHIDTYIQFAHTTKRIIIMAFWISVIYNVIGLSIAMMGLLSPLTSAILMPVSNVTVILFTTLCTNGMARWKHLV